MRDFKTGVADKSCAVPDNLEADAPQKRPANPEQSSFFPLFVDMTDRKVLILGGGNVAARRVRILASFGADITVISPKADAEIKSAASTGSLSLLERRYQKGDISAIRPFFIIAATDDRQANHEAMTESLSLGIPASIADSREECTCCFPAIAESGSFIAGLVSKNGDHKGVKQMAQKIRELLMRSVTAMLNA